MGSGADEDRAWRALLAWREALREGAREHASALEAEVRPPTPLFALYSALLRELPEKCAVAHLAQSLDGRIATTQGGSRWISGEEGLRHAHRMRALFDAVVVGAETARLDDPQLTVRLVAGPNPVRVVVDPGLSLREELNVLSGRSTRARRARADPTRGR